MNAFLGSMWGWAVTMLVIAVLYICLYIRFYNDGNDNK